MLKIKRNVWALGLTSFFNDVSSEMIMVILPLFLTSLGASRAVIGLIEGVAEATASFLKILSGWLSDQLGKRKMLIGLGYTLSTLTKPLIALANSWPLVLFVRFTDRVGKGVRNSPRDALVADSTEPSERGLSFGFHRAMDTAGAVVGTLLASLFLYYFSGHLKMELMTQYRTVFWLSVIPGLLSVLTIVFLVKDLPRSGTKDEGRGTKGGFYRGFTPFLVVMGFFQLANFSYALFILRAADLGVVPYLIPIIYLVYNLVYVFCSVPLGQLSDKLGRKRVLSYGFLVLAFLLSGFALATQTWQAWPLFAVYGIVSAITESTPRAFVSDLAAPEIRGTAYGIYYALIGVTALPASALAGWLWDFYGPANGPIVAFGFGTLMALIATALLLYLVPDQQLKTKGQAV
ncbi:MAG: MFS transporter [Candidatus Margulisbacteria bacterium]|jgi:MFS family permease|nr:MFS transporter [Candidatus Margulisiibacteriota bacterium]